jgi:AGZA family xanthine/uracil permease-like MFS transporter
MIGVRDGENNNMAMTDEAIPAAPAFRYRGFARGDINGFFALSIDNIALLVGMSGILMGVFHLPAEVVLGGMVPGTAAGVLAGDLAYSWLAWRLARRERRQDVCAMPLGIDTPSMFALTLGVVGPAYAAGGDARRAWAVGMAVLVIMGVGKVAAAFCGEAIRRALPRAALLAALGAVAIALIMFFPFTKLIAEPVGGLVALGVVLITLVGGRRLPFGIPAVIAAVVLGYAASRIAMLAGYHPPEPAASGATVHAAMPWPTLAFTGGLALAWHYIPLALPVALATIIGGIDNTESAAVAGDRYSTRSILMVEGLATLLAGLCGGVVQNTPYIGHPAYKDMGCRAGYTIATGIVIGVGAAAGWLGTLIGLLPESVVVPVLVFIGLEMAGQSLRATDARHSAAWGLAMIPALASLVGIQLGGVLGAAGIDASRLPEDTRHGLTALAMLGNGFILTSMLWMSWMIWVIDGRFGAAAALALVAAALTLFGVIHSPFADGHLFLPWTAGAESLWLAVGYVLLAAVTLAFTRRGTASP